MVPGKHHLPHATEVQDHGSSKHNTIPSITTFILVFAIFAMYIAWQCVHAMPRNYSEAFRLYTSAVGVLPLLWCLVSSSGECSGDRDFRKSCTPTQQVHTVHGTNENKLQSSVKAFPHLPFKCHRRPSIGGDRLEISPLI